MVVKMQRKIINPFNQERIIRDYRNKLLTKSDWTQGADSPLSEDEKVAWAAYRQSLRDITKQDLNNIQWPAAPG
jgi:Phage tail assembly chaperone protein